MYIGIVETSRICCYGLWGYKPGGLGRAPSFPCTSRKEEGNTTFTVRFHCLTDHRVVVHRAVVMPRTEEGIKEEAVDDS